MTEPIALLMSGMDMHLQAVWNQQDIPVLLYRTAHARPRVQLPPREGNHAWMWRHSRWHERGGYWVTPKRTAYYVAKRCIEEFGSFYVIQPYDAPPHPEGRWVVLSDWNGAEWCCRLLS